MTIAIGAPSTGDLGQKQKKLRGELPEILGKPLGSREREAADLARAGKSNAEIAAAMGITVPTEKLYLYRVMQKQGCIGRSRSSIQ